MKIKDYSEMIVMIAKVEDKKATFEKLDTEFHDVDSMKEPERWMELYEQNLKARKALKKAYSDFRKKIETSKFEYLMNSFKYSVDSSDKNFYYFVSREILKDATNVEFN